MAAEPPEVCFQEAANEWWKAKKRGQGFEPFLVALNDFVHANENVHRQLSAGSAEEDEEEDLRCLADALSGEIFFVGGATALLCLQALKILTRKRCNRQAAGHGAIAAVVRHLTQSLAPAAVAEAASVLLNLCYEVPNVLLLLQTPAPAILVQLLQHEDVAVQASCAGAIQSISYQEAGRRRVREEGAVPSLVQLLASPDARVQARAVGALHNLSTEPKAIRAIRRRGGIPLVVALLEAPALHTSGAAAGTLQNVAREVASRLLIRESDAVPALARLLSAEEVDVQVCAAGALLNILGPELDAQDLSDNAGGQRRGLGSLVSLIVATSAVYQEIFGSRPPLDD